MKIGIVTQPLRYNYGGILQNYAFQVVLKKMGHSPITLNEPLCKKYPCKEYLVILLKRFVKKYFLKRKVVVFEEKKRYKDYKRLSVNTKRFVDTYISIIYDVDYNKLKWNDYDALVVGSDQVWRPMYNNDITNSYFSFAEEWPQIKRISYAASFGTAEWEYTPEQTKRCKDLIHMFDCVTVRETSGITLCKEKYGINAQIVLDPTLLLDAQEYIQNLDLLKTLPSSGNLFYYVLDESDDIMRFVSNIAKRKNLRPFRVNSKVENHEASLNDRIQPPVEKWVRAFMDAEFIVTDSFHACAFSIIFNKPFVVVGNRKRGQSRFDSLLNMFGLQNRFVDDIFDFDINAIEPIDWGAINRRKYDLQRASKEILITSLSC